MAKHMKMKDIEKICTKSEMPPSLDISISIKENIKSGKKITR